MKRISLVLSLLLAALMVFGVAATTLATSSTSSADELLNVAFGSLSDAAGWSSNVGAARYFGVSVDGQSAGYVIWVSRTNRIEIMTPNMLVTTNKYDTVHAEFEMWLNEKTNDPDLALDGLEMYYSTDFGATWAGTVPVSAENTGKRAVYDSANQGDVYKVRTGNLAELLPGTAITNFKIVPYAGVAATGGPKFINFRVLGETSTPEPTLYEGTLFALDTDDVAGWKTNSDRALITSYSCLVDGGEAQKYVTFVVSGLTDLLYGATPDMKITMNKYSEVAVQFSIWRHVGTTGTSDPEIANAALYYSTDFGSTWSSASIPLTAINTGKTAVIAGYSGYFGPVYTYTTGNLCDVAPGQVITNFKIVPFTALTTAGAMRLMDFTVTAKGENEIVPEPVDQPTVLNDSPVIQALIDGAKTGGGTEVTIPQINPRDGSNVWVIGEAIKLPSDMTVYIDNCTLRLADGVYSNIFCNETAYNDTLTAAQEQHNIKIIGIGNATLDGGNPNGLTESTAEKNGLPHIIYNTLVFMRNVDGLEIRDLKTKDSRWWTFTNIFCRNGLITNIDFSCRNNVPNQDGVDLRIGCNNFTISNLTGDTGDDSVALTALLHKFDTKWMVQGKDTDIHDVEIKNINTRVMGGHHIVRLLMQDGNKVYNIDIDGVYDATIDKGGPTVAAAVKLGDTGYATIKQAVAGDMYGVSIKHVTTRASMAIRVGTYAVTDEHFTYSDVVNVAGKPIIGGSYTPSN